MNTKKECLEKRQTTKESVVNMPLKKSASKEAFTQNLHKELGVGKPLKQAIAIAYSVKRNAMAGGRKKRK